METSDQWAVDNGNASLAMITPCPLQKKPWQLRTVGVAESTVSGALFLVNVFFLVLLYRRRRVVNWKTHVFALNLALSDLFASMALLIQSVSTITVSGGGRRWCAGARSPMSERAEVGVRAVVTASVCLTVLNYNVLVLAQYCAVRAPILHRTYFGAARFRRILILSQWALVLVYVGAKSAVISTDEGWRSEKFAIFELTFTGLSMVWSVGAYSYVLHVAKKRQDKRLARQRAAVDRLASTARRESDDARRRRLVSVPSLSDAWVSLRTRYRAVINAGIHLAIYVAACAPLWFVRLLLTVSKSGAYDVYSCSSIWCSVTACLWCSRGVLDPLVHVWRHPEFSRRTPAAPRLVNAVARASNELETRPGKASSSD